MIEKLLANPNIKKYLPYLIMIFVTCLIGIPLFNNQVINGHDGMFHFFRSFTTRIAIADGQLIPMINPNMMGGFGYSYHMFYGSFFTYVISLLSYITGTVGLALNLVILVSIFLSGIFMYHFMKDMNIPNHISLVSAILYMCAPYHLIDIYIRMAVGEVFSFIFIPLVFHGIYSILNHSEKKWWYLTIGASGLLLTHNVSTLITAIFAFLYVLFSIKKLWNKNSIQKMIISLAFAILISFPTLLPLIEAKSYSDYMVFDNHYMNVTAVGMNRRRIHLFEKTSNPLYITVKGYTVVSIITVFIILSLYKGRKEKIDPFGILAILSVFLTLAIIPWHLLPSIFCIIQFPWRYLFMASFFFSIVIPVYYQKITKDQYPKFEFLIVILALVLSIPFIKMGMYNTRIDNQIIYSNDIKKRNDIARSTGTASAEYLPRNAIYNYDYLKNRKVKPILLNGEGRIQNSKKVGTRLSFDIQIFEDSLVELPYIAYPGYIIKVNGKEISSFETVNGLLGIKLGNGDYHIESYYRGSNIMIASYTVSVISGVIFLILRRKV